MRKLLKILAMVSALPAASFALGAQSVTLVNETGLTFSTTYQQNLNAFTSPQIAAGKLAVQVIYSSTAYATSTFTDGTQSTGSLTVVSTAPLAAAFATNTIVMPSTASILGSPATAQITIVSTSGISNAFITITTPKQPWIFKNGVDFNSVSTASGTASALATAINGKGGIVANWPGGTSAVVYTSASVVGVGGNSYTLSSSLPVKITTSAAVFSGGLDPILTNDDITYNGFILGNGYQWTDASGTSTGTAASIARALDNFADLVCTSSGSATVSCRQFTAGTAGNAATLSASAGMTVTNPTFFGGQDNASFTINGVTLTIGTQIPPLTLSSTTANLATAIATAINANTSLNTIIAANAGSSVVFSTSILTGTVRNYTTVSSTQSKLSFANATMTGGTNAGANITTDIITIPAHGYTKALGVVYSTGSGASLGGLVTGTTYFVIVVDANNIELSTGSTAAVNGVFINMTSSSSATTAHTFTLTPQAFTQGAGSSAKWQVSNDGVNWADYLTTSGNVTVSSQTFTPVFPNTSAIQDFGIIDYQYLRYNVLGPSQGGIQLKVILNSKD